MLAWFFATIWHALIGLILLAGFFLGAVVVLARAIFDNNKHDQAKCMCNMCKSRRIEASRKRYEPQDRRPNKPLNGMVSTEELSVGMRVVSRNGTPFRVADIRVSNGYYFVTLKNPATNKRLDPIVVSLLKSRTRMWKRDEGFRV